ncbi:sugar ABC transporter permease [Fervidobacterium pennivorans subsp. shakshaketiis]|uniref:Carbohydrate ABC transporter membrane protein 1, CUT1 family n=1 Tax=Fervidobacterium pennivorans (strain DSM 9078 / Ven5) TaxID=771875 RepID=H9UC83_FERPD|nr:sugar ABC transporter permease [Fervidobacterium pennivorans]AFG35126.1 carbohydrate ABC transporter membrane protein 1, CUT1 family [Fervidobacterium pennivorans DSM 9078]
MRARKRQTIIIAVLFLAVPLTLLSIFTYYPIIRGIILSFCDYNMFTKKITWVGLSNYKEIFRNKYFYEALVNILKYLIVVPFIQFVAILTAILVNQKLPGIKFFRTLFYVPVITGSVIVSMTWRWIYNVDGLLNSFLLSIGVIKEPVMWLTDERFALYSVMFVTFWRGIGYYMVIYLAGLQNIPTELYEAAKIDGANSRHLLTKITLPLLKPTMLFCFTISSLAALKVFEEVFLMTQGGSGTTTMMYLIYDYAFVRFKFGLSTATSVIFAGILITFTVINFKFFGPRGEKK